MSCKKIQCYDVLKCYEMWYYDMWCYDMWSKKIKYNKNVMSYNKTKINVMKC